MIEFFNLPILINHYLILSSLIFLLGVTGIFLNRKNVISILMSIELILLGVKHVIRRAKLSTVIQINEEGVSLSSSKLFIVYI